MIGTYVVLSCTIHTYYNSCTISSTLDTFRSSSLLKTHIRRAQPRATINQSSKQASNRNHSRSGEIYIYVVNADFLNCLLPPKKKNFLQISYCIRVFPTPSSMRGFHPPLMNIYVIARRGLSDEMETKASKEFGPRGEKR